MQRIAAVVVTYNRKALLSECLTAIRNQQGARCDILVVNNASTDGTERMLAAAFPEVPVLTLPENTGGAGGFCAGMRKAVSDGYDRIWIMDDDTIPEPDALAAFVQTDAALTESACRIDSGFVPAEDCAFGFLSSTVRWTDGSLCKMNLQTEKTAKSGDIGTMAGRSRAAEAAGRIAPVGNQIRTEGQGDAGEDLRPISAATFVSLYFPAQAVRQAGLPIADYFIWGDDKEYTLRLSDRWPCWWVTGSSVVHKTANNEGSSIFSDDPARADRYYYAYRNDLATARRRGAANVLVYLAGFALNACRVVMRGRPGRRKRLSVMFRGMRDGWRFSPEIPRIGSS